jgi:cation transporter-like permease
MNYSQSKIRWLRVIGASLAVIASSFLILMAVVVVYAFVLAFRARGAPDQNAINHFASWVSPRLMPWLEMLLTLAVALRVARRAENASVMHGLLLGFLAGLLGLAVTAAFGGRLGLRNLLVALAVTGLGWLGGFIGGRLSPRGERCIP